jgi:hypothetical protein
VAESDPVVLGEQVTVTFFDFVPDDDTVNDVGLALKELLFDPEMLTETEVEPVPFWVTVTCLVALVPT